MVGRCSEGQQRATEWLAETRVRGGCLAERAACGMRVLQHKKVLRQCLLVQTRRPRNGEGIPEAYIAMQAYLSERILCAGDMVGQSIQPSNGFLAGCSLGNRFARVILYKILGSVNNVLPAPLPAPVETRQFVDDLTTMSVANNEDDVTRSICSVDLELRHELEAAKLILNKKTSE